MGGQKRYNTIIKKEEYSIMIVKYKEIELEVLIDNEDVDKVVSLGSWHAILDKTLQTPSYYIAHRFSQKENKSVAKLHRLVTNCPRDKVVDHINHNTLDNRKCNLRVCTIFENQQNLRSCKTGYPGVYFRKSKNRWVGNISKDKKKYTKEFSNMQDAINWRNEKQQELYRKGA